MVSKKKFVEIDEKYVDQKNHQMLTYIGPNREGIRQKYLFQFFNIYFKKIVGRSSQKKDCFLAEVKKSLQPTKTLAPPPPHISNGVSLTPERLNYVTVFSVKAVLPWKLQLRLEIQVKCRLPNIF